MKFYEVSEHLPPEGIVHWCYSAVHQVYYAAEWSPDKGWRDENGNSLKIITHWCDMPLPMPYPSLCELNKEAMAKHNYKIQSFESHLT